jgi:DNA-directed RNA polymerase specialized sigma subunit
MNFNIKMDDKKIKVNIEDSNLKDVLKYCKPKEQLVLLKKFGLMNGVEIPLQRIGKEYNLTRERVRQIESQALMRFRRLIVGNDQYMKVLEEAKKILTASGGILEEAQLIAKLVNKQLFSFTAQELKLVVVSDFNLTFLKRNKYINKCFYTDPIFEDFLTNMVVYIKDYFETRGQSVELYEFIDTLKTQFGKKYDYIHFLKNDLFYINFFACIRAIKVFDGKIGLATFSDVYPKTIKLKILYTLRRLNKPYHYQELPAKIIERFPQKGVKVNTIHNELVKNNDMFVNLGLGVYGLRERGYEGGLVKTIIMRILKKFDRPMSVKEICRELLKEKMVSPNTVLLNLQKFKEHFERVDKGVYRLVKE